MTDLKKGLRDGIPIGLGYISVSFTFGLQSIASGLNWWETVLVSLTNLTSAGQFAGLDIMVRGGGFWVEMACAQLIINLRYALMSLSLSQKTDKSVKGIHRWLTGFGITDEIFAVSMGNENEVSRNYLYGIIALPVLGWTSGTFLGAVAGQILPGVVRDSLCIAIYGMFLAIIIPPAKKNSAILKVIVISVLLSCAFKWVPVLSSVSSGFVIIICTVVAALVGAIFFPIKEETQC
ncbi:MULTISPECIES: AzlC family ABC transporter permease [unclassified Ruminococcus]|uniref:AzlC family ABC transporter permease n=1 Tax=unclassified Ruminococcus TaxID=2608920 RepID=UPI00210C7DDC|nr:MULTISPECIES: AzlC family ABC transporter permease [unclassified Ruminococcus]